MRILKIKATNRIIEAQSHATEGTLLSNALSRGFDASEVEESLVTQEQYNTLMDTQNEADKTYSDKRRLEYPSIEELIVALYDTEDKLVIETKRAEIKAKYPKG
tara:strand:+ start:550 stop:861 length:312 start_codon:yes stop_codon:yes gene_type:complete